MSSILDQIFMKILGGEDHRPITPYYVQVYANLYLDLSTFQFEYYLFWPIDYVKRGSTVIVF
jgi:hypothetical protein